MKDFFISYTKADQSWAEWIMLLFAAEPPAGVVPPMPAPQADRASALLTWAEAPGGCGLTVIQEILKTILDPK
jgi:hypothetical protein